MDAQQAAPVGYSESYAELHNYKYCFLNNKKRVGTSNSSGTLDTIVEETDDQINAELEVDVELENLSALTTISESATPDEVSIEIEGINSSRAVTQFDSFYLWEQFLSFYGVY